MCKCGHPISGHQTGEGPWTGFCGDTDCKCERPELDEHRPEPVDDERGALICALCQRPVRTAHGGRFAVHASV